MNFLPGMSSANCNFDLFVRWLVGSQDNCREFHDNERLPNDHRHKHKQAPCYVVMHLSSPCVDIFAPQPKSGKAETELPASRNLDRPSVSSRETDLGCAGLRGKAEAIAQVKQQNHGDRTGISRRDYKGSN